MKVESFWWKFTKFVQRRCEREKRRDKNHSITVVRPPPDLVDFGVSVIGSEVVKKHQKVPKSTT